MSKSMEPKGSIRWNRWLLGVLFGAAVTLGLFWWFVVPFGVDQVVVFDGVGNVISGVIECADKRIFIRLHGELGSPVATYHHIDVKVERGTVQITAYKRLLGPFSGTASDFDEVVPVAAVPTAIATFGPDDTWRPVAYSVSSTCSGLQ